MRKTVYLISFLFFVFLFFLNNGHLSLDCGSYKKEKIKINNTDITVDISNDNCKRKLGLSGRKSLSDNIGMLFLFEKEGRNGIWMKDMNFPIDIIWFDSDEKIILLEKNIAPETYPGVFGEDAVSKFVLEVRSGFIEENNLKIGDKMLILKD